MYQRKVDVDIERRKEFQALALHQSKERFKAKPYSVEYTFIQNTRNSSRKAMPHNLEVWKQGSKHLREIVK